MGLGGCSLAQPISFPTGWGVVLGGGDPLRKDEALNLYYSPSVKIF